jgi:hypothetical protein
MAPAPGRGSGLGTASPSPALPLQDPVKVRRSLLPPRRPDVFFSDLHVPVQVVADPGEELWRLARPAPPRPRRMAGATGGGGDREASGLCFLFFL